MGSVFSIDDLIGKRLYARKKLTVYAPFGDPLKEFLPGELVGVVHSWTGGNSRPYGLPPAPLKIMFEDYSTITWEEGLFDLNSVYDQGAVDVDGGTHAETVVTGLFKRYWREISIIVLCVFGYLYYKKVAKK